MSLVLITKCPFKIVLVYMHIAYVKTKANYIPDLGVLLFINIRLNCYYITILVCFPDLWQSTKLNLIYGIALLYNVYMDTNDYNCAVF